MREEEENVQNDYEDDKNVRPKPLFYVIWDIILCKYHLSLPRRILFATNIDISGSHLPSCQEDCNLGEWGEWSECSQSCGQDGVQVT